VCLLIQESDIDERLNERRGCCRGDDEGPVGQPADGDAELVGLAGGAADSPIDGHRCSGDAPRPADQ
jgi:hypothetical protein